MRADPDRYFDRLAVAIGLRALRSGGHGPGTGGRPRVATDSALHSELFSRMLRTSQIMVSEV